MSSVAHLRHFVNERLNAAAEEIFGVFQRTIVEYEEVIDRQRRLLNDVWKSEIQSRKIELPRQPVYNKEAENRSDQPLCNQELRNKELCNQQLCNQLICNQQLYNHQLRNQPLTNQGMNSSVVQTDAEPLLIKEEEEELSSSQDGEQLEVIKKTDTLIRERRVDSDPKQTSMFPPYEGSKHSESELVNDHQLLTLNFPDHSMDYENETDHQHRLPINASNSQVQSQRIELSQQIVCKEEEDLTDQQVCNQERNSNMDIEEPEPIHIKEEEEELCSNQEGEPLELKPHTDIVKLTISHEEIEPSETRQGSDDQLVFYDSFVDVNYDQTAQKHEDSGLNTDTSQKSVFCDFCGKAFRYNYLLELHMRVHTGEKPFRCNTCGKRFTGATNLNKHLKVHTEHEKPFSCETCGEAFRFEKILKSHMRVHSGKKLYPCSTCGKSFPQSIDLKRHKRIHTGEKPFSCEICEKSFTVKSNLQVHMTTHTGERPFSCGTCGKSFNRKSNLNEHMKSHTSSQEELVKDVSTKNQL